MDPFKADRTSATKRGSTGLKTFSTAFTSPSYHAGFKQPVPAKRLTNLVILKRAPDQRFRDLTPFNLNSHNGLNPCLQVRYHIV